ERRDDLLLAEVLVDHLAVGAQDHPHRPRPVASEGTVEQKASSQLHWTRSGEKRLPNQAREGAPLVDEAAIRIPFPRKLQLQRLRRAVGVAMDEERITVFVGGEEEWVQ